MVSDLLNRFTEGPLIDITVDLQGEHFAALYIQCHLGFLCIIGECGDAVDLLLDVLIGLLLVGIFEELGNHCPRALGRGRSNLLDTLKAADGFLYGKDDPVLNFLG